MTQHAYVRRLWAPISMNKFKECNLEWEQQQMRVTFHLTACVRHNSVASTHEQEHISMQMDDGLDPAAKATQEFLHKEMSRFHWSLCSPYLYLRRAGFPLLKTKLKKEKNNNKQQLKVVESKTEQAQFPEIPLKNIIKWL